MINHECKIHFNGISQSTYVFKVRHVLTYLVELRLLLSSFSTENMLGKKKKIKRFSSGFGEKIGKASFPSDKKTLHL